MNISKSDLVNLLATNNYIVYNQVIAKKLGVEEAILLGVLCSYQKYFDGEEFYREEDKLAEDTSLSIYAIRKAKQHLKDVGVLEITKKGLPAQHYFKIHPEKIFEISTTSDNENNSTSGNEMITTSGNENITTRDDEIVTTIYNTNNNTKNNNKYIEKNIKKRIKNLDTKITYNQYLEREKKSKEDRCFCKLEFADPPGDYSEIY